MFDEVTGQPIELEINDRFVIERIEYAAAMQRTTPEVLIKTLIRRCVDLNILGTVMAMGPTDKTPWGEGEPAA